MSFCNGPLNKNFYTQQLELIAKCLIQVPEKIVLHSELDCKTDCLVFSLDVDGCIINLSNLFKKANFSHLYLNEADSQNYLKKYNLTTPAAIKSKFPKLTEAEKRTINAYSACSEPFNSMLYGNKHANHQKETIIDCVLLASGLNKIDSTTTYNLPREIPNTILPSLRTYRGEVYMTEEIVNCRKAHVAQGGGSTRQYGFMSISYQQKVSRNFSRNSLIIFEDLYGKDITELANDPREQEFLLPPCQIFWYDFKNDGQSNLFYGKVVEPLNENTAEPTPEELETFKRLLQWAQQQGIQISRSNPLPSKRNKTFAFSLYPYSTAFLIGIFTMISSTIFVQSIMLTLTLSVTCGTVALAFLVIRNNFYQKWCQQQKNRHLFQQDLPTPQKAAFENGYKAAHGWFPYFQSQFETTNWTHMREFATGYYEELNRLNTGQRRSV